MKNKKLQIPSEFIQKALVWPGKEFQHLGYTVKAEELPDEWDGLYPNPLYTVTIKTLPQTKRILTAWAENVHISSTELSADDLK